MKALSARQPKLFYGWVQVGMAVSVFAAASGALYYTFGVFLGPMIDEMGWSRGSTSVAFSLFTIVNGASGPVIALIIERAGPRRTMLLGQGVLIGGLLLLSRVTEVWHLFLVYGILLPFGLSGTTYLCATTLLSNWFVRRRSLAIGISMAGSGLGAVVLAPIARILIDLLGWRDAWMVMAGVIALLAFLPTLLLARDRPEQMGQAPDGDAVARPGARRRPDAATQSEWSMGGAFRTPALWFIVLMATANTFALSMLTTHQVIHLEDIGIEPVAAASALGLMVGVSSIGRLVGGAAGQWLQLRYIAAFASVIQVVGLVMLTFARGLPMVYAYVLLFGFGYGAIVVLFPSIVGAYFGRRTYSRLFGALFAVVSVLGAAAPAFAGYVFDAAESYLLPFSVAAGFCGVAAVGSLLNKPPVPKTVAAGHLQHEAIGSRQQTLSASKEGEGRT